MVLNPNEMNNLTNAVFHEYRNDIAQLIQASTARIGTLQANQEESKDYCTDVAQDTISNTVAAKEFTITMPMRRDASNLKKKALKSKL